MKRILAIITALTVIFSSTACTHINYKGKRLRGSGNLITKMIDVPDYRAITAERTTEVIITDTPSDKIYIKADDNVMPYVVITARNGLLKVTIDPAYNQLESCTVEVRIPDSGKIEALETHSSADIKTTGLVKASDLKLEAHSSGEIEGRFQADKCTIEAHSSADIDIALEAVDVAVEAHSSADVELEGSARTCRASLHSAADLKAARFVVEQYDIQAASAADASINCTGLLKASASSAASIVYTGDCRVDSTTSSAGSIRKR